MSSWSGPFPFFGSFPRFGVLTPNGEKIVISISFYFIQCVMVLSCTCVGRMDKNLFMLASKTFMEI
jgi:hypothetical protein